MKDKTNKHTSGNLNGPPNRPNRETPKREEPDRNPYRIYPQEKPEKKTPEEKPESPWYPVAWTKGSPDYVYIDEIVVYYSLN
jgi:hypothetical protein